MTQERSNVDKAYDHIRGIDINYPDWPATMNPCVSMGCGNTARGHGYCADCHEVKLAEYCGQELAAKFHEAVKERSRVYSEIESKIRKD